MLPLRFCMITTFYPPYAFGGDAIFVHRLSNMLARHGHEVEVIHCVDSYRSMAESLPLTEYPNEPGVTVHGLVSGVGIFSPFATYQTGYPLFKGRSLHQILETKRFDVIHFHNISLIGGPMVLRYGTGVKLYTLHEHWLFCPTHVLFKFNREACVKPSCLRCLLSFRRPPQLWRYTPMLAAALRHVDAFLAPSEFTLQRHRAAGLDIPLIHLPPFVNESAQEKMLGGDAKVSALPPRPFFLFVGRLEKLKGLQTLIPVFRDYAHASLLVAGDGTYAEPLKQLAAGNERVHFLGQLTPSQLRCVYARAIALLVPSLTFETFGQVIIEAFASHTPVIVRDLGPLPEIVAESGGGFIYRDTSGLLEAMARLQSDPATRNACGEAGYRAYRMQWAEEVHYKHYIQLIAELQARKRESVLSSDGRGRAQLERHQ